MTRCLSRLLVAFWVCYSASALAQAPAAPACRNPPPAAQVFKLPEAPSQLPDPAIPAIPGVVDAGQRWKSVWTEKGSTADGIIAADDGGILIPRSAQNDVIGLAQDGKVSVRFRETRAGVALSRSRKGLLFIARREPRAAIWQLTPEPKVLADSFQDEPFECVGSRLNDLAADSKDGVYFTMGGLYYADSRGTVTRYGENLRTNGLILSPDEKVLYVTNRDSLVAFDVRADGSLTSQRTFASLPDGSGDGSAVDSEGRIYVSGGSAGVRVIAPSGQYLGTIPTPFGVMSLTFGGMNKRTLFAVIATATRAQVVSTTMVAQGFMGRAK